MQDATIAARIRQLKDEIRRIEEANREYRKINHLGYRAQKLYEDRRLRLVQIQEEIRGLLKTR